MHTYNRQIDGQKEIPRERKKCKAVEIKGITRRKKQRGNVIIAKRKSEREKDKRERNNYKESRRKEW